MKRTISALLFGCALVLTSALTTPTFAQPAVDEGPFKPTYESLKQYQCPDWFRDAKFGIWAHWGPQAVPGEGDWYARRMYMEGSADYQAHTNVYGHPSQFGYKDIIPLWKAEKWDPVRLMDLYKKAGAKYFVAQGVHHDNFDNWNSKFHRWNSVNMGPHKDIVGLWRQAAIQQGLRFGVSEHLERSYSWFNVNKGADKKGPLAGVPYDGNDTNYADFYFPPHADANQEYPVNPPEWWKQEWLNRITDLVDQYQPDLLYTDGGVPFHEVGRSLVAHYYNSNLRLHGKLEAVYNIKNYGRKDESNGEYVEGIAVQDVERGDMRDIQPAPWQTDTSMGDWFYRKRDHYKTTGQVIHLLADIVSKNGNLLLNVVQYPDGSLPPEMETFLTQMAGWMSVNSEAIYGTRPWKTYGEGPTVVAGGHFKEDFPFTAEDIRFTTKAGNLYALAMGVPTQEVRIKALGRKAGVTDQTIAGVTLVGSAEKLNWSQEPDALVIQPATHWPTDYSVVFKIVFAPVP